MMRCNLAILLAERNLKITKVSNDTGISRTTLTALSSNNCQGIQLDTYNNLCIYLKIDPNQLFSFVPFNIRCSNVEFDHVSKDFRYAFITLVLSDNFKDKKLYLNASVETGYNESEQLSSIDIHCSLQISNNDIDIDKENLEVLTYLKLLPVAFLSDLANEISEYIKNSIGNMSDMFVTIFEWPKQIY